MTDDQFQALCNTYGFAPSRALRELIDCVRAQEREACAQIADEKEREMQARVDTLHAMYEQACQHRDQLMDERRATIAAMRGKTQ